MSTLEGRRRSLRVIGAIAVKDVADALKNRTILSTILSLLFLIILYRFLPGLESGNRPPQLVVYDAHDSSFVAQLEHQSSFDLYLAASIQEMRIYLGDRDSVMLGLVLPEDFDQQLAEEGVVQLPGYVVHWARADAARVRSFFEAELSSLTGRTMHIDTDRHVVYTQKDSRGYALLAAMSVIFAVTIVGISVVPNLMLEEKRAKTLAALLVSPASPAQVVAGKGLAGLFYCLTGCGVAYALNLSLIHHWWLAGLAALCGALFAVAVGLLLGACMENRGQLTLWAWMLFVPLLVSPFLSIAQDLLPTGLIAVLGWVPTVALSKGVRVSFAERASLGAFGPELLVVLGWAVPFLAAVVWRLRRVDR